MCDGRPRQEGSADHGRERVGPHVLCLDRLVPVSSNNWNQDVVVYTVQHELVSPALVDLDLSTPERKCLREPLSLGVQLVTPCTPREDRLPTAAGGPRSMQAVADEDLMAEHVRAAIRDTARKAMLFDVVAVPLYDAHRRSEVIEEIADQIRSGAAGLPEHLRNAVEQHVTVDAERILDAGFNKKIEIWKRLQPQWTSLSACDRLPWGKRHLDALHVHNAELQLYTAGLRREEPKRPPAPFYLWMQDNLQIAWNVEMNS